MGHKFLFLFAVFHWTAASRGYPHLDLAIRDFVIPEHAKVQGIRRSKVRIADMYLMDIRHQAKHVQKPDHHEDYHNAIQYGFDRALHGDQIDQPQKNSDYEQRK
jgi:hypothetical protein